MYYNYSHRHLCVYSRHERNEKINILASVLSVENKYPVLQVTEIKKSVPPQVENKYSGLTDQNCQFPPPSSESDGRPLTYNCT